VAAAGFRAPGKRAVLIGAGGAARAVGYALVRAGVAGLHLANRTPARAEELASDLAGLGQTPVSAGGLAGSDLEERLGAADLIVQATPAGFAGGGLPVPLEWLPPGRLFCELGYGPLVAPLVAAVRAQGLRALSGEEMLLHQGALAFARWTGREPSLEAMRSGLRQAAAAAEEEESSSGPSK
jgi:shikimate dehydrogenase